MQSIDQYLKVLSGRGLKAKTKKEKPQILEEYAAILVGQRNMLSGKCS